MTQNPLWNLKARVTETMFPGGNNVFSIKLYEKNVLFCDFFGTKLNFLCHKMSSSQISKSCRFLSPHIIVLFFSFIKRSTKTKGTFPKQKNRAHLSYPFEVLKKVQTKLLILILKS